MNTYNLEDLCKNKQEEISSKKLASILEGSHSILLKSIDYLRICLYKYEDWHTIYREYFSGLTYNLEGEVSEYIIKEKGLNLILNFLLGENSKRVKENKNINSSKDYYTELCNLQGKNGKNWNNKIKKVMENFIKLKETTSN